MSSTLGNNIRKIRGKESQANFGSRLGVDRTTIGSWEIGRHEPNTDLLKKIAEIGNVSLDWLCGLNTDKELALEHLCRSTEWQSLVKYASDRNLDPQKIIQLLELIAGLKRQ